MINKNTERNEKKMTKLIKYERKEGDERETNKKGKKE
jgi:hypothetical protein